MTRTTNDLREAGTVLHDEAADRIEALEEGLSTAIGNMMNAAFDLEGKTTKAFAIGQLNKAIDRARALLNTGEKS